MTAPTPDGGVRFVDVDSPDYRQGVEAANLMLDTGGLDAAALLELSGLALRRAHDEEDTRGYHRMAGLSHTLREYLEGQA